MYTHTFRVEYGSLGYSHNDTGFIWPFFSPRLLRGSESAAIFVLHDSHCIPGGRWVAYFLRASPAADVLPVAARPGVGAFVDAALVALRRALYDLRS